MVLSTKPSARRLANLVSLKSFILRFTDLFSIFLVGIKKFKEPDDDEIAKKTIMREVRMLRMLKYKNIVTLKEAFKRKGRLYLVFEYVEKNLLEVLEENSVGIDVSHSYCIQTCLLIHVCCAYLRRNVFDSLHTK